jgi:hypothetical protein
MDEFGSKGKSCLRKDWRCLVIANSSIMGLLAFDIRIEERMHCARVSICIILEGFESACCLLWSIK